MWLSRSFVAHLTIKHYYNIRDDLLRPGHTLFVLRSVFVLDYVRLPVHQPRCGMAGGYQLKVRHTAVSFVMVIQQRTACHVVLRVDILQNTN